MSNALGEGIRRSVCNLVSLMQDEVHQVPGTLSRKAAACVVLRLPRNAVSPCGLELGAIIVRQVPGVTLL